MAGTRSVYTQGLRMKGCWPIFRTITPDSRDAVPLWVLSMTGRCLLMRLLPSRTAPPDGEIRLIQGLPRFSCVAPVANPTDPDSGILKTRRGW